MKRLLVLAGALALGLWVAAGTAEAQAEPEGGSITAVFSGGTLTVTGTSATTENILIDRTVPGTIRVNGGAVVVSGGPATIANTDLIVVRGVGGRDVIDVDDAAGALPPTELFGGGGDDNIQASNGVDLIVAGPGDDFLYADDGADTLDAGTGDDSAIWVSTDDEDEFDGGAGVDHLMWGGSNQADEFELTPIAGGRVIADDDGTALTLDGFETAVATDPSLG